MDISEGEQKSRKRFDAGKKRSKTVPNVEEAMVFVEEDGLVTTVAGSGASVQAPSPFPVADWDAPPPLKPLVCSVHDSPLRWCIIHCFSAS